MIGRTGTLAANLARALILPLMLSAACASRVVHEGPSTLDRRAGAALMRTKVLEGDAFEHFWLREGGALGAMKWSLQSAAVAGSAPDLLEHTEDGVRSLDDLVHGSGPPVEVVVTYFSWRPGSLGGPITVGVECVGRAADGTIQWMGVDHFQIRPDPAGGQEGQRAAVEFTRRLRQTIAARMGSSQSRVAK